MTVPAPRQLGQVCAMLRKLRCMRTCPCPAQVVQVTLDFPGCEPLP
jgi:hypothetical protein